MSSKNYAQTLQEPLRSGFNAKSTSGDVIKGINLTGKVAIVTGGYAGIGLETTKALSDAGAKIIVPARDVDKAKKNLAGIKNTEIKPMDLSDPSSIIQFCADFVDSARPLHLLINNAGVQLSELERDAAGHELHFSTNHLGHFLLTAKLWGKLKESKGARVVNLSSYAHRLSKFNFEDPDYVSRQFHAVEAYAQSKTANNLFTVALDKLGKQYGVRAFAAHPGSVGGTDLSRNFSYDLGLKMGFIDENGVINPEVLSILKSVAEGAATSLWCAASPSLVDLGGVYCEDSDIAFLDNNDAVDPFNCIEKGAKPYSLSQEDAQRLWELSESLTGVKFE